MKTTITKIHDIKRAWHHIDAKDKVLGRLATDIAQILIGKNKVSFTPNLDCGDYVVITNVEKIQITGRKDKQKMYYHHSNYPGGLKTISYKQLMEKNPAKIITHAVNNMLPKNKLREDRLKRLKLFVGEKHNYQDKFTK